MPKPCAAHGLAETLQRDYRVVLAGPTTFAAAVEQPPNGDSRRAGDPAAFEQRLWKLLGDVKQQFGKYSEVLANIPEAARSGHADGG